MKLNKTREEKLIEFKDLALISKKLVTLKNDVPINLDLAELKFDFNKNKEIFSNFLQTHSFKRLIEKISDGIDLEKSETRENINEINNFSERKVNYELVTSENELKKVLEICNEKSEIAIDCETNSLNFKSGNLVGLSIAYDIGEAVYIPLRHINNDHDLFENKKNDDFPNQIEFEKAINLIKPILEDPSILKIGHNIKFDMNVLRQNHNGNIKVFPVDDTMCMSYCTILEKYKIIN